MAIEGQPIDSISQLRFQVKPRYAGETLRVSIRRGEEQLDTDLTLVAELERLQHAFLGMLPARSPAENKTPGVDVRLVWPDSPADRAGLQKGDRITKMGTSQIAGVADAATAMHSVHPGEELKLTVERKNQELVLSAKLSTLPEDILPAEALALDLAAKQEDDAEVQLEPFELPEFPQKAMILPGRDDASGAPGLILWLGSAKQESQEQVLKDWQDFCRATNCLLMIASPEAETIWSSSDEPYLQKLAGALHARLGTDRRRTVVVGHGKAGQLALGLAFAKRSSFAGVVAVDAPLPRDVVTAAPRSGSTVASQEHNSPADPTVDRGAGPDMKDVPGHHCTGFTAEVCRKQQTLTDI